MSSSFATFTSMIDDPSTRESDKMSLDHNCNF